MTNTTEISLQTQRNVAIEVSVLLARLTQDYGLELDTAVDMTERALARSYWGELPEGYSGAIVPAPASAALILRDKGN